MARILAAWELGLGYGHLAHLTPVSRTLTAMGHEVALAAQPHTPRPDHPFATILEAPRSRERLSPPALTYTQALAANGLDDVATIERTVRSWLEMFRSVRPDVVLIEHAPFALLAAHVAQLPMARIGTSYIAPPPTRPGLPLQPWLKHDEAALADADRPADGAVREACRRLGGPPVDGIADLMAAAPEHLLTWPELDHFGPRADAFYYGPAAGFGGVALPDWPPGGGPRVFVYLPERPTVAPVIVALAKLGWPTVWHRSDDFARALPDNIHHTRAPLDMVRVLGETDVMIGRAGHGSCCDALRAGVQQLFLPDTVESSLLAFRMVRSGLGLLPAPDPDTAAIEATLHALLEPAFRAKVQAISSRYAAYDPVIATQELAEDILYALDLG